MVLDLAAKLKELPAVSGVYIMLDEYEQILYVGKAKNLKSRVRQYFQSSATKTEKTMLLVAKIADFRYIITNTEYEALVLENNLIKEHKPYYNILLKDDKTYPYIKINLKDTYPRIEVTRKLKADGSKYFGPYMLGLSARTILNLIHSVYKLRTCRGEIKATGRRECLNYHIGICLAPCTGRTTEEEYRQEVMRVIEFLKGNDKDVRERLKARIVDAIAREEFESAITYRDSLEALDKLLRRQALSLPKDFNLDIFAYATNGMYGVINYMPVRGGKVLGAENYPVDEAGQPSEILSEYIMQFYEKNPVVAEEIVVSDELPFEAEIADYLTAKKGSRVRIFAAGGGAKKQLIDMSYNNASEHLSVTVSKIATKEALTLTAMQNLQHSLGLNTPPKRIECYDISNISGTDKVASMVVFINGESARERYRRFRIKTVKGIDDFASIREVVSRRVKELNSTDLSFSEKPNLIIIDGGKGQLSSAMEVLEGLNIAVIGLAKREEEVFLPEESQPIILPRDSLELKLIQRVRDEAHRFAITYHRTLRKERQTRSSLKNIEGIGDKLARALLIYFKKVENIKNASIEEIMKVDGFGEKNARAVYEYFNKGEVSDEI
ncbi:MAG: excinuclease ABC subunit UvrC [Clostridia bacterium]